MLLYMNHIKPNLPKNLTEKILNVTKNLIFYEK